MRVERPHSRVVLLAPGGAKCQNERWCPSWPTRTLTYQRFYRMTTILKAQTGECEKDHGVLSECYPSSPFAVLELTTSFCTVVQSFSPRFNLVRRLWTWAVLGLPMAIPAAFRFSATTKTHPYPCYYSLLAPLPFFILDLENLERGFMKCHVSFYSRQYSTLRAAWCDVRVKGSLKEKRCLSAVSSPVWWLAC